MAAKRPRGDKSVLSRQAIATRKRAIKDQKLQTDGTGRRALLGVAVLAVSVLSLHLGGHLRRSRPGGPRLPQRHRPGGPRPRREPARACSGCARTSCRSPGLYAAVATFVGVARPPPLAAAAVAGPAVDLGRGAGAAHVRGRARLGARAGRRWSGRASRRRAVRAVLGGGHGGAGERAVRRRAHRRHPVRLLEAVRLRLARAHRRGRQGAGLGAGVLGRCRRRRSPAAARPRRRPRPRRPRSSRSSRRTRRSSPRPRREAAEAEAMAEEAHRLARLRRGVARRAQEGEGAPKKKDEDRRPPEPATALGHTPAARRRPGLGACR